MQTIPWWNSWCISTLHMRIVVRIMNIVDPNWFHVFIQNPCAYKHENIRFALCIFVSPEKKIFKIPIYRICFDFCNLSSTGDVVSKLLTLRVIISFNVDILQVFGSVIDYGFESRSGRTKDDKNCICYVYAMQVWRKTEWLGV